MFTIVVLKTITLGMVVKESTQTRNERKKDIYNIDVAKMRL